MKALDPKVVFELRGLLSHLVEGTLDDADTERLREILRSSEEARRFYVHYTDLHMDLERRGKFGTMCESENPPPKAGLGSKIVSLWIPSAAAALVALWFGLQWNRSQPQDSEGAVPVAFVGRADGVEWNMSKGPAWVGMSLSPGPMIRMEQGTLRIDFMTGAAAIVEGPAEFRIIDDNSMELAEGRLAALSDEPESLGFAVLSPGGLLVDYGTEFSVSVARDRTTSLHVFEGEVVAKLERDSATTENDYEHAVLAGQTRVITNGGESIKEAQLDDTTFIRMKFGATPPLVIPPEYISEVREARPWGYWRCEDYERVNPDGRPYLPNEMGDFSRAWRTEMDAPLVDSTPNNKVAILTEDSSWHGFFADQPKGVISKNKRDFTIEAWFCPGKFRYHSLASITQEHVILTEDDPIPLSNLHIFLDAVVKNRTWADVDRRFRVRYNVIKDGQMVSSHFCKSEMVYQPNQWYHVVVTKKDRELSLYVNGNLEGSTTISGDDEGDPPGKWVNFGYIPHKTNLWRKAVGALDEFACYAHALSAEQIQRHHTLVREATDAAFAGE